MAALTKEQWYSKLKSVVPGWVLKEENAQAIFKGIAKAMAEQGKVVDDHVRETYIDLGSDEYVELQGAERSVTRFLDEDLISYRPRVKSITNQTDVPAIKALVDSLLIRGKCTIIEHHSAGNFMNAGAYLDRNIIDFEVLYNAFTILIDYQIPEPTSFLNLGTFLDNGFVQGSSVSSDKVFRNIIQAVNKNIAYGCVYRLIERVKK